MKKTMIFAGMLSIGYAYAQRGNVGINTASPNATLEVKVADVNSNNDTNQGVLIPKLSKTRVAAIADGKLVKGTLVFVEGIAYAGTNAKVVDINADGFYYYNGTKWVKVEGSVLPSGNANGQVLKWNGSAWIASTDDNTNIYTNDGTLPTNRTVDLNAKTLGLNSGVVSINSGDTWAPLRIHSTYSNGAIIALSNNNWDERVQLANTAGDFSVWSNGITHFSIKKNTGNVGLGLLNPTAKLDVNGDARIRTLPAGATTDQIVTTDTNGNLRKLPISSIDTNTTYTAGAGLTLAGTEFSLPVTTNGIGSVVTGITQTANGIAVTKGDVNFTDTNTNIYTNDGTLNSHRTVNLDQKFLNFENGITEVKGGSDITNPLRVSSAHANGASMIIHPNNTSNQIILKASPDGDASLSTYQGNGYIFIQKSSNNVGIGTSTPTAKLDVAGTGRIQTIPTGATTDQVVTADANGNLRKLPLSSIDTNTTYTAGAGLTLAGTEFSLPVTTNGTGSVVTGITQTTNGITVTKGDVNFTDTNTNIYTNDGQLPADRTVDLNSKNLNLNSGVVSVSSDKWAPLRVSSTDSNGAYITLSQADWNQRTEFINQGGNFRIWANGYDRFSIEKTNGNVAIGGETPTAKLDVVGNARIRTLPAGTATDQIVTADANGNLNKRPLANVMNDFSANFIINQGTTTQSANFRISGTGQADTFQTITSGNAQGYARLNSGSSTATGWLAFYRGGNNTEKLGHIGSNNVNMFYQAEGGRHHIFATTGNVGIGTENPTAKLDVAGTGRIQTIPAGATTDQVVTTDANGNLRKLPISSIGGTTNIYTSNGTLAAARTVNMNGNNLMFTGTGNVGIGTATPTTKLDVSGDIRTNAVIYNSDARLKKDVKNISNATATVNNLRSVTYHWNADGKKKGGNDTLQYGFIAQEVEKVLPALVNTDKEGYKSVNYVAVVPVLVKALQEKDAEVKKLQTEMEQMKKEVEQIKQLLKK